MPATYESLAPNGHSTMVTRIFQKIKSWVEGQGYSTTDEKVYQALTTSDDEDYRFLLSGTADDTPRTETSKKSPFALMNPNDRTFTFGQRKQNSTVGYKSIVIGDENTSSGTNSFAIGQGTQATGICSYSEGYYTQARTNYSHAEGYYTQAGNSSTYPTVTPYAHAEGNYTKATGSSSHAEGQSTTASGDCSHAEGGGARATVQYSHAEGGGTSASNFCAHAEGGSTTASGNSAHAEGGGTTASGDFSHAEGGSTVASSTYCHSEGFYTKASSEYQHVQGKYNIEDTQGTYAHIIGNGYYDSTNRTEVRSNAQTIDWDGNEVLAGMLTDKHGVQSLRHLTTAQYNALTEAEKMNGVTYHLIDSDIYNAQCYYDSTNERIIFNYGASYDSTNERITLS